MMLYPAMSKLTSNISNRYCLVNVVARRARQLTNIDEREQIHDDTKTVTRAINEIAEGQFKEF